MTDLVDMHTVITIKAYLRNTHNGTMHTVLAYIEQLERERDAALIRCEQLRKQLAEAERE